MTGSGFATSKVELMISVARFVFVVRWSGPWPFHLPLFASRRKFSELAAPTRPERLAPGHLADLRLEYNCRSCEFRAFYALTFTAICSNSSRIEDSLRNENRGQQPWATH